VPPREQGAGGSGPVFFLAPAPAQQPADTQLRRCSACHGPQGNSQVPAIPSLAGQPQLFIENQMVLIRDPGWPDSMRNSCCTR
jgi:cytochrome c553